MRITLRAASGYLTAELGGEPEPKRGLVTANRQSAGAWETWTVEKVNDGIALKSVNGFYLCAEGGGGSLVYANREHAGAWETWHAVPELKDGQAIVLNSSTGYALGVSAQGEHVAYTGGTAATFTVEVLDPEPIPPEPSTLSRLVRIDGHRMVNEQGEKVYGKTADAFLLYKKFLDGRDILLFLKQHQELGFNVLRIFGMFESLGGFDPKQYPSYYTDLPMFLAYCNAFGAYPYWVACAATQGIFNTDAAVASHVQKTIDGLLQGSALFSAVNEQGQHNNSINRQKVFDEVLRPTLGDPRGTVKMLYDTGSFGVDAACVQPFGTHAPFHSRGDAPASVKDMSVVDHPNYVNDRLQVYVEEPGVRFGAEGKGDDHENPNMAADCAGTAYTALGWCFHSMQGERADALTGNTLDCATAAMSAMKGH